MLAPAPDDSSATDLIDIRGVGDSAFSKTHQKDPMPGCASQARNFIGRALYDASFTLKQVQLVPVTNTGIDVKLSTVSGTEVPANLDFTSTGRGKGAFANIKP